MGILEQRETPHAIQKHSVLLREVTILDLLQDHIVSRVSYRHKLRDDLLVHVAQAITCCQSDHVSFGYMIPIPSTIWSYMTVNYA
jgi:hypothetical protein